MKTVWIMTSGAGEIVGVWDGDDLSRAMMVGDRLAHAAGEWERAPGGSWHRIGAGGCIDMWLDQHGVGCGDATVCRDRYGCDGEGSPLPNVEAAR